MSAFEFPFHLDETVPTRYKAGLLATMTVAAHESLARFGAFDACNWFPAFSLDLMLAIENFLDFYFAIHIFRKLVTFHIRLVRSRQD